MYEKLIDELQTAGARKATKFLSEREVIRVVRTCYRGRLPRKGSNLEVTLTRGRPNFEERLFIKKCLKAGEPFPVRKIQFKFPMAKGAS